MMRTPTNTFPRLQPIMVTLALCASTAAAAEQPRQLLDRNVVVAWLGVGTVSGPGS